MEYYIFTVGNVEDAVQSDKEELYTYTSYEEDLEKDFGGEYGGLRTFKSVSISRDEIEKKFGADQFKVTMPLDLQPSNFFKRFNPKNIVTLTVFFESDIHINNYKILFKGFVDNVDFDVKNNTITYKLSRFQELLEKTIPTRTYSASCPFGLYSVDCSLNKDDFKNILNVSNILIDTTRKIITTDDLLSFDDKIFSSGFIQINDGEEIILATKHSSNTLYLLYPLQTDLVDITEFRIFYGCNKNTDNCQNRFNNIDNYGGFPFVPSKNPTLGI